MTESFKLRIATPDDGTRISDVLRASYTALMPASYGADVMEQVLPLITRANPDLLASGTYYLVETALGDAVGCGGWTTERPGTGEVVSQLAHLRHFATHPDVLERGIGRMIYGACSDRAKTAGIKKFMCYSSLNAISFYTAMGFDVVERMDIPMGRPLVFPSVLMETIL